jgi:hypothetical protein
MRLAKQVAAAAKAGAEKEGSFFDGFTMGR